MGAFSKRYFLWISLILLAFLAFAILEVALYIFVFFALFLAILSIIHKKSKHKNKNFKLILGLMIAASLIGCLRGDLMHQANSKLVNKYSGEQEVYGYVSEVANKSNYMCEYVLRVESVDGKKANFDLVLWSEYLSELERGDFIRAAVTVVPSNESSKIQFIKNKNTNDYPLAAQLREDTEIEYLEASMRVPLVLSSLNSQLSSTLKAHLGTKTGSLASALLLGNRELLEDDILRDFKRTGVYHMLALSGLHVAILIGILEFVLKKLRLPIALRIIILGITSLFYVALTGFLLSATRSMLMLWIMYLAIILGKKRDALTSLFLAVMLICLISPGAVLDIGLLLSFLSTFGVIAASIIRDKIKFFNKSIEGGRIKLYIFRIFKWFLFVNLTSLCVFVCTLPVISICFGEISLATFFSNLFMGAVCELFMIWALITLLLSATPIAYLIAYLTGLTGNVLNLIISKIADVKGIMLSLEYPAVDVLVLAFFIVSILFFGIRMSRKWILAVPCVAFALLFSVSAISFNISKRDTVTAEFLVGDKLMLSNAGEVYICDASNGRYGGFYDIIALAKENCFTEIDGVVLTHYHSTQVVTVERLAKNYKIHSVLLPTPKTYDEGLIMRSIVRVLEEENVEVYIYDTNKEIDLLGGKLTVSDRAYFGGYAHPSVAFSFAFSDDRITLLERPYFDTYLEESESFTNHIIQSDYLIYGSDGRSAKENFELFAYLLPTCEVSFTDFESFESSDYQSYLDYMQIYFGVEYKKYQLK